METTGTCANPIVIHDDLPDTFEAFVQLADARQIYTDMIAFLRQSKQSEAVAQSDDNAMTSDSRKRPRCNDTQSSKQSWKIYSHPPAVVVNAKHHIYQHGINFGPFASRERINEATALNSSFACPSILEKVRRLPLAGPSEPIALTSVFEWTQAIDDHLCQRPTDRIALASAKITDVWW